MVVEKKSLEELVKELTKVSEQRAKTTVPISPSVVRILLQSLNRLLKSGNVSIEECESLAVANKECIASLLETDSILKRHDENILRLQTEIEAAKSVELQTRFGKKDELVDDERRLRKSVESQLAKSEETIKLLESKLMVLEKQKNVTETPKSGTNKPKVTSSNLAPKINESWQQIIIPSENELAQMSKQEIADKSKELGFDVDTNDVKKIMIEKFVKLSEELVNKLMKK